MEDSNIRRRTVKVVVLGDIGRSPRMQYHSLSLARAGFTVSIIGYKESRLLQEIEANPHISVTALQPFVIESGPKILLYCLKAFWQFCSLFFTLLLTGSSEYLLCQNPPAVPTLPACWLYCLLTRTKYYIDWHNYACSIMAMSLRKNHPLLRLSTWMEKYFGRQSAHNFCVTNAMKLDLEENWSIRATVLYDRPPRIFRPITINEKHDFLVKMSLVYKDFFGPVDMISENKVVTAFTQLDNDEVKEVKDRPGLLFSSTSWTPDEDFGVLLNALDVYESSCKQISDLPDLRCIITGKGPMKEQYCGIVSNKKWQHVKVLTPWLESQDYPTMVASCDLGVCLHTSSSGLDLPMKVVDMFGAGLPVCAYKFKCLNELVQDGENGYTFQDSQELAQQIIEWFKTDSPGSIVRGEIKNSMKKNLEKFQNCRWEENWEEKAKPYFK